MERVPSDPSRTSATSDDLDELTAAKERDAPHNEPDDYINTANLSATGLETPGANDGGGAGISRSTSNSDLYDASVFSGNDTFPPLDRLSMFDILENLALPQRLETMQNALAKQTEKLRQQRQKMAQRAFSGKQILGDEWRKRKPAALGEGGRRGVPGEEQLDRYRRRMKSSLDRFSKRWNDSKNVELKEKISFVTAVLNIFLSGYLIGEFPQYFHLWYTAQLLYFMPVRYWTYHKIGYHYFLADLCYFVNLLLTLTIWCFPQSKRLLISTFCLAFGNNAVAIAMWRNSLVLHSLDKVTSLFIHIMPCATLHVMVHLLPESMQRERFPAVHTIKYSAPSAPEHYTLFDMAIWATLPYAVWQLSYHLLITIRRRDKIAQGRPTSFTFLRKSYANNFLGKFVLSFPDKLQEPIFMAIQYAYAMLTMLPCPLWFWYRWASAMFLLVVLAWASWNGATYYIDVFGRRFEKELNNFKKEVAQMSVKSPSMDGMESQLASPVGSPAGPQGLEGGVGHTAGFDLGPAAHVREPAAPNGIGGGISAAVEAEDSKKDN